MITAIIDCATDIIKKLPIPGSDVEYNGVVDE